VHHIIINLHPEVQPGFASEIDWLPAQIAHRYRFSSAHNPKQPGPLGTADSHVPAEPGRRGILARIEPGWVSEQGNQSTLACTRPVWFRSVQVTNQRVIYLHAIKKVAGYAHAIEKFPDTCVPCPKSSFTSVPFWMDSEITVSNEW
jgi:hypothetical protein